MRIIIALAVITVLPACATLTEEECRTVDWTALGAKDGENGFRQSRIGDHLKACMDHGLPVNQEAYLRGWWQGIPRYCTAQNGYEQGVEGKRYRNACPPELEPPFLAAYTPAKRVYDAEVEVDRLKSQQEDLEFDLDRLRGAQSAEDKARRDELRDTLREVRRDLRRAEREESRARQDLLLYISQTPGLRG